MEEDGSKGVKEDVGESVGVVETKTDVILLALVMVLVVKLVMEEELRSQLDRARAGGRSTGERRCYRSEEECWPPLL